MKINLDKVAGAKVEWDKSRVACFIEHNAYVEDFFLKVTHVQGSAAWEWTVRRPSGHRFQSGWAMNLKDAQRQAIECALSHCYGVKL